MSLYDQLKAFDLAWGDLRRISAREDVKAALNWAWDPLQWRVAPDAQIKNALEQAMKEVKKDVVDWIKRKCGDLPNPEETCNEFQKVMSEKDSTVLYKLARNLDATVPDIPERVKAVLKRANAEDTQTPSEEPGAIRRYVMFEYIAAELAVASQRLVGETTTELSVLVDTNVILDIIIPRRRKHEELVSIFRTLSRNGSRLKFLVTTATAAEVRWRLGYDLNVLLSVQARVGKKNTDDVDARKALLELTDATKEYLLSSRNGGTWSEFADQKMAEALGVAHGPVATPDWRPEIVTLLDDDELLKEENKNAWKELVDAVRSDPRWGPSRRREVDEHDIALIAKVINADPESPMTIWSRHRKLHELESILLEPHGLSAREQTIPVVTLGNWLFPWAVALGMTIDVAEARRAYREALFPLVRDEKAEHAQLYRVLERLNKTHVTNHDDTEGELAKPEPPQTLSQEAADELQPDWATHPQWREDRSNAPEVPVEWLQPDQSNSWTSLSLEFTQSSGGHLVHAPEDNTTGRRLPKWELPIHAVTHVDLPWALLESEINQPANFPRSTDVLAHALRNLMLRPRIMETIVLDYRDKQNVIKPYIENECEGTIYLRNLDGPTLKNVIKELAIDSESIQERLKEIGESAEGMGNKCVVIHTGWIANFMPGGEDLAGIGKEMSVAVLVHPWLTADAAALLREVNVASLAIDCHMADNPGYLAAGTDRDEVGSALQDMRSESETEDGFTFLLRHQPVHTRLLARGVLLFELLNIPESPVGGWYRNAKRAFKTYLYVAFLYHAQLMDGAICKMLMRKPQYD